MVNTKTAIAAIATTFAFTTQTVSALPLQMNLAQLEAQVMPISYTITSIAERNAKLQAE